jgi:aspartyl-tRNA(Asn)/glutamyl-tRNA(Gln) amidotransferase subunit C
MSIGMKEVEHVANLARLALSEEEKRLYAEQLGAILAYVGQLNELDTDGIEPTSHALALVNVLREDEERAPWPIDKVLLNAPDAEEGQFKVPAVLE